MINPSQRLRAEARAAAGVGEWRVGGGGRHYGEKRIARHAFDLRRSGTGRASPALVAMRWQQDSARTMQRPPTGVATAKKYDPPSLLTATKLSIQFGVGTLAAGRCTSNARVYPWLSERHNGYETMRWQIYDLSPTQWCRHAIDMNS